MHWRITIRNLGRLSSIKMANSKFIIISSIDSNNKHNFPFHFLREYWPRTSVFLSWFVSTNVIFKVKSYVRNRHQRYSSFCIISDHCVSNMELHWSILRSGITAIWMFFTSILYTGHTPFLLGLNQNHSIRKLSLYLLDMISHLLSMTLSLRLIFLSLLMKSFPSQR